MKGNSILPKEERKQDEKATACFLKKKENKMKRQQHTAWRRKKHDQTATAYCLKKKETRSNGNSILPEEEKNQYETATAYCLWSIEFHTFDQCLGSKNIQVRIQKFAPDPEICPYLDPDIVS